MPFRGSIKAFSLVYRSASLWACGMQAKSVCMAVAIYMHLDCIARYVMQTCSHSAICIIFTVN